MKTTVNIPDEQKDFIETLKNYLKDNQISEAWELTTSKTNKKLIGLCSQEIFAILHQYLNAKTKNTNSLIFDFAQDLVQTIAKEQQPEETLLELLEFAEKSEPISFTIYMKSIQTCLHKMPRKRGTSIIWVCNTIIKYLCEIDPELNIKNIYYLILDIFKPYIHEINTKNFEILEKHQKTYTETINKFMIKLLGKPLAYTDYSDIYNEIFNHIISINPDVLHYINHVDKTCSVSLSISIVEAEYTNLSLMVYFYIIYHLKTGIDLISHVYSIEYILNNLIIIVQDILWTDISVQLKSCFLMISFLERIHDKTLEINKFESNYIIKFMDVLTHTMIYSDDKNLRHKCVFLYKNFIYKFNSEGRYMLLNSLKKIENPGLIGYGITILKDIISETLNNKELNDIKYFTGIKLKNLILFFTSLEPDLVRNSDKIISLLNLLRFIIIRDNDNTTNIINFIQDIQEIYVKPLKSRIEEMRVEFNFEKDGLVKCLNGGMDMKKVLDLTFNVPIDEQIKGLDASFTILDLIDSLVLRLEEFLKEYKLKNL